ncbi:hypothetical protein AB1Y20_014787 [Prymnesium parvum]|uniref:N-acetyltransferase domain-containing protein n=1 Tax=Prymnesium parvum TaxID=97485 RepID=A0AB34IDA4_PRYPA
MAVAAVPLLLSLALPTSWTVRVMRRADILPIARLLETSFAGEAHASWSSALATQALLALDVERRCTTWEWSRHLQLVAESAEGRLLGFAEVWGEDEASVGNQSAHTPQPCLFNLCVARDARRRGVARALIQRCEEACAGWGEAELFLKVRDDNEGAYRLYAAEGYDHFGTVAAADDTPHWQVRWKGGLAPLRLMRKPLGGAPSGTRAPFKRVEELQVSLDYVLSLADRDALVWFVLLVLRNSYALAPAYRLLLLLPVLLALLTYRGIAGVAHF